MPSARQPQGGDQVDLAQDYRNNRKNIVLLGIMALIVVYIAVSVYGIIRDIGTKEAVLFVSCGFPGIEDVAPQVPLIDRIKNYFNPAAKVIVPVEKIVSIKGRVIYTDGTPFANGLVELRSEPRINITNQEGKFIFEDVAEGSHTISVLDQNHQVLASCIVEIKRNIQIKDAVLVEMEDGTFVIEVAVNVEVLEIVLEIRRDGSGQPRLIIRQDVKVPDPLPAGGKLTVYSSSGIPTHFSQAPAPAVIINIFGSDKKKAPGMTGSYKFTIDNTANSFAIYYDIDLIETNNELNIPMKYRLYNNKTKAYVNGDSNWHTTDEIRAVTADSSRPLTMADSMKTEYILEWLWEEEGTSDHYGVEHGGKVACTLLIKVSAQRK